MSDVAVATSARTGAEAGVTVSEAGGNAVDAALATLLVSLVTEPGICSIGGGAFLTVWPPGGEPVTVDGYVEMPGRGARPERFGEGGIPVHVGYGGGLDTVVGPGSVAVPGVVAALGRAWERYGRLEWSDLLQPAIARARDGFPLSSASRHWLEYTHEEIFGRDPGCRDPIHRADGTLKAEGEAVRFPRLAETLEVLAREGAGAFYRGELARRIAGAVYEAGGLLTADDLAAYEAVVRKPVSVDVDGWRVATNPPPAVGGAALAAMLLLVREGPAGDGAGLRSPEGVRHLARVQETVFRYRKRHLERTEDLPGGVRDLLEGAGMEELRRRLSSPSTVHTSAVDADGLACSVSASTGYGSGVVPPGTGIWLNNCLGEKELNRQGFHALRPGTRLPSNMAPTAARRAVGPVLAVGSPGADRITTALLVTLSAFLLEGLSLEEAVAHPRLHVELDAEGAARAACEPGLPVEGLELPVRSFDGPSMFFGGVTAALRRADAGFEAAADPRREGSTAVADGGGGGGARSP